MGCVGLRLMAYTCAGRGTCEPDCPMYGVCHCGCGEPTTVVTRGARAYNMVRGRPRTFIRYHPARLGGSIPLSRAGLDSMLIRSELLLLVRVKGSRAAASRELGQHESWVSDVLTGKLKHVRFNLAQRVFAAVRGTRDSVRSPELLRNARYKQSERDRKASA